MVPIRGTVCQALSQCNIILALQHEYALSKLTVDRTTIAWLAFGIYVVATTALALAGMRKTKSLAGFALGNRDMGPVLVGITLAAATASTATFVINPGFVYSAGLAALLHFGVASVAGVAVGLIVMSKRFRKRGNDSGALTLPHWIGARYDSPGMRIYFALLNLVLAVTFVVLLVKGSAIVMQHTLGMSYGLCVVIVVGFVFSYIMLGGTYAHAYTNAFQGVLMVGVALLIVGSGLHLLGDGIGPFFDRLAEQDPNLIAPINKSSALFGSLWEIWVCGFVISFALVCQPHILMKALYLERDKDVNRYLTVAVIVGFLFSMILIGGLYARLTLPDPVAPDAVMAIYVNKAFSPILGVLISVALLAAGMSTLDGILVSASTIAGNDLFLGALGARLMPDASEEQRQRAALQASRVILVVMGAVALVIALEPPALVGLFAQAGIYGLVAASLAPVAVGVFVDDVSRPGMFAAAIVGPLVHFAHYGTVSWILGGTMNPAVSGSEGIAASLAVVAVVELVRRTRTQRQTDAALVR